MSRNKKRLTNVGISNNKKTLLIDPLVNKKEHPEINFKYLYKCNVCCFNGLNKYHKEHKEEKVFNQLQEFLYNIDKCSNLEEVITQYTSRKGSKVENNYIKRIKQEFETAYPDEKGLLESNIIHLHLKRNGKGKFVIFGVNYDSVFYVLAFDPGHSFDKL